MGAIDVFYFFSFLVLSFGFYKQNMSNKIGLLLPRSVIYPTMSFDMMAGLRQGLAELGIKDAEIKTENAGLGAEPKDIYAACEKLIFDGCMVVLGYVNPVAAEALEPLFASAGGIFIALEAGYHFPLGGLNALPHVFTVSLDGVLCCRIMASTAAADGCKRMAYVGSFYEAGYRSVLGFHKGLEEAGGAISYNHITQLKRADFTLAPLLEHIESEHPDGVLASFCGDMLQDFCMAAAATPALAAYAIYGSAFMADEIWLAQCPYPGMDIQLATTWGSGLVNDANNKFKETMAANKQRVNIWSMIAWEASRLAAVALLYDADGAIAALEALAYDGPRGHVAVSAATHRANSPVYTGRVIKDPQTNHCQLQIEGSSPFTADQRTALEDDINKFDGQATSWKNAYGCLES